MYFDQQGVLQEGAATICVVCWQRPVRMAKDPKQQAYLAACRVCEPREDPFCPLEDEGIAEFIRSINWIP